MFRVTFGSHQTTFMVMVKEKYNVFSIDFYA